MNGIEKVIKEASNVNLLVKVGPTSSDCHYVESLEAENGKIVVHASNRGDSPQLSFCLLDNDAPVWILRQL